MSFSPRHIPTDRPWQQGGEEPVSFGSWLRRQREVREISLREIADASKISLRYLEAFEQDRFDVLPAPIFARGFLREYAKYVGLDPDEVVNHFLSAKQALEPEGEGEPEAEPPPSRSSWTLNLLLVLAVLTVIVLVALLAFHAERTRGGQSEPAPAMEPSLPAPPAGEPPSAAAGEEAPSGPVAVAAPAATVPAATVPAAELDGRQAGPEAEAPLTVTLEFRDRCWVVVDVDGRREIQQEVAAGESLRLEAQEQVRLTLGNAGGVEVRVNGQRLDLGRGSGEVARGVTIDLDTARLLAEGA